MWAAWCTGKHVFKNDHCSATHRCIILKRQKASGIIIHASRKISQLFNNVEHIHFQAFCGNRDRAEETVVNHSDVTEPFIWKTHLTCLLCDMRVMHSDISFNEVIKSIILSTQIIKLTGKEIKLLSKAAWQVVHLSSRLSAEKWSRLDCIDFATAR